MLCCVTCTKYCLHHFGGVWLFPLNNKTPISFLCLPLPCNKQQLFPFPLLFSFIDDLYEAISLKHTHYIAHSLSLTIRSD